MAAVVITDMLFVCLEVLPGHITASDLQMQFTALSLKGWPLKRPVKSNNLYPNLSEEIMFARSLSASYQAAWKCGH